MPTLLGVKPGTPEGTEEVSDRTLRRTYRRTFIVQADSLNDREVSILLTPALPGLRTPFAAGHDVDLTSLCIRRTARMIDRTKLLWEVDCEFAPEVSEEDEEEDEDDPVDLPVEVDWDYETIEEVVEKDAETGAAIATSAGEAFTDPPITRGRAIPVLQVTRYERFFFGSTILAFVNHVNSASFAGAAAGQVLCAGIRASKVTVRGYRLWRVSYVFKFNMSVTGWRAELLDRGSYFLDSDNGGAARVFEDVNGNPRLGNLDGVGEPAFDGDAFFETFNIYESADFSALGL